MILQNIKSEKNTLVEADQEAAGERVKLKKHRDIVQVAISHAVVTGLVVELKFNFFSETYSI